VLALLIYEPMVPLYGLLYMPYVHQRKGTEIMRSVIGMLMAVVIVWAKGDSIPTQEQNVRQPVRKKLALTSFSAHTPPPLVFCKRSSGQGQAFVPQPLLWEKEGGVCAGDQNHQVSYLQSVLKRIKRKTYYGLILLLGAAGSAMRGLLLIGYRQFLSASLYLLGTFVLVDSGLNLLFFGDWGWLFSLF